MKKILLILLCLPMIGFGQGWIKNFYDTPVGFPNVYNVVSTVDSGYAVFNYYGIIKTNALGDTIWTNQNYEGTKWGIQTYDGGYMLFGWFGLFKLDNLGSLQWSDSSIYVEPKTIDQTIDSGYVYTGTAGGNLKADEHLRVVRTNSNGDTLWTCQPYPCTINTGGVDIESIGSDVHQTSDGNYIVAGYRYSNTNSGITGLDDAGFLSKINNAGDTLWTKTYLLGDDSGISSVFEKSNGNFVFAGHTRELFPNYTDCRDLLLAETDHQGNIIWVKTYGYNCDAEANSIEEAHNGGFIVCGVKELNNGEEKIWVLRTNNFGDTLWTRTFGNPYGFGMSAKKTLDGGYIITGPAYQNSFSASIMLIKIDDNGNITSEFNIPLSSTSSNRKIKKTVDMLGRETKQKNNPLLYIYDDGTVEKRIVIE